MENRKLILINDLGLEYPTNESSKKRRYAIYKCYCGNEFKAQAADINSNKTKSCGCLKKSIVQIRNKSKTIHGFSSNRLYDTWYMMIQRCNNPINEAYKYYGARGITVCDEWLNIENFINDMFPSYKEGLTLDRINNDGNYSKDNCRWETKTVQARNTKRLMRTNTSGYRGVMFNKICKKFTARITINSKKIHIGTFNTANEASLAYDNYINENNLEHTTNGVL